MTSVAVAAPARTRLERWSAALPVLTVFAWLCLVYGFEAWLHGTPWLFTDELELTQLSRAIAATGHAARRGEPHSFDTLYTYLLAPAWWIHGVESAYSAAKYIGVATMTCTLFPAWLAWGWRAARVTPRKSPSPRDDCSACKRIPTRSATARMPLPNAMLPVGSPRAGASAVCSPSSWRTK